MGLVQRSIMVAGVLVATSALVDANQKEDLKKRFEAMRLFEEDRWGEAMDSIGWAVEHGPTNAMNYYWRARIRMDEDGKIADLSQAIHLNPDLTQAYLLRAQIFAKRKLYRKALLDYNLVIDKQPLIASYYGRGCVYFDQQLWPETIADLAMTLRLDENHLDALEKKAFAYAQNGETALAIADYRDLVKRDFFRVKAWAHLGALSLEVHQYDIAVWALKNTKKLGMVDVGVEHNLGLAWFFVGNYEYAEQVFRDLIAKDPHDADAYNHLATVLMQRGFVSQARALYDRAIEEGLDEAGVYYNRARAAYEELDLEVAIKDLKRVLQVQPTFYGAHRVLGDAYRAKKVWGQAIRHYQMYLKSKGSTEATLWYDIADTWMKAENFEQATVAWSQGIVLEPGMQDAYFQRARCYSALEDYEAAVKDYQVVITIDPDNAEAYYNLGNIAYRRGHFDQSVRYYDQALNKMPGWKDVYYNRSLAKQSLGDRLGAQKDFQLSQLS